MRLRHGTALRYGVTLGLLGIVACEPSGKNQFVVNLTTGTGQMELFQGSSKVLDVYAGKGTVITFEIDSSTGVSVRPNPVRVALEGPSIFYGSRPALYASPTAAIGRHQFKISATNTSGEATKTEIVPYFATVLEPFSFASASNTAVSGRIGQVITGSATVDMHRDFTGPISYSITGLPQELVPTVVATKQGSVETVDFTIATQSAFAGTYPAQLVATSNGVVRTSSLSVLVLAALPAPDLSMRVLPSTLLMQPTGTAFVDITLTRTGVPAVGDVNLTVAGLPDSVTASFQPARVVDSTSRLVLVSSGAPPAGPVDVVIQASSGSVVKTAVVKLTIAPTMTLTAVPSSITLSGAVPQTVEAVIKIARVGAVGNVSFSTQGAPSGITPTFTQSVVSDTVTTLRFTVDAMPLANTYAVLVTGTGQSGSSATVNVSLVVPAPTGTFTPAFNQLSFTAPQNSVTAVQLNLPRTGALVGAPLGITVTTSPPSTVATPAVPSTTATTVPINLTIGAPQIGPHNLTVSVTDGATVRTATTTIFVTAALPTVFFPAFEQSSYSIPHGPHHQLFRINLARPQALVGVPLTISISAAPPGAVAGVITPITTGDATTVSLVFNGSTNIGPHQFTVNITNGTTVWTATTTINITAPMEPADGGSARQERQHPR